MFFKISWINPGWINGTSTAELFFPGSELLYDGTEIRRMEAPLRTEQHHTLMLAQINNLCEPIKDKGTFLGKTLIIWSLKDILSTHSRSSTLVDNTAIKFLCSRTSTGSMRWWRWNACTDQVSGSVELSERIMGDPSWSSCWSDSMSAGVMRCTSSQSESRDADRGAKSLWLEKTRNKTTEVYIYLL